MALLVSSGITIFGDISLDHLYIRLDINFIQTGNEILVTPHVYSTKQSFKSNRINNEIFLIGFDPTLFYYKYEIDGDMIQHAHNQFLEYINTYLMNIIPVNTTIVIDLN
jgi:hypothetical protein